MHVSAKHIAQYIPRFRFVFEDNLSVECLSRHAAYLANFLGSTRLMRGIKFITTITVSFDKKVVCGCFEHGDGAPSSFLWVSGVAFLPPKAR